MQLYAQSRDCCCTVESNGTRVLSISPESTSTRVGVFEGERPVFKAIINHAEEELAGYSSCREQLAFRKDLVLRALENNGVGPESLTAVIGRGGVLKPLRAGTYRVNDRMIADLDRPREDHPSNLGGIIAYEIARAAGVPAYIADPMSVDEFADVLPFSGLWESERRSPGCKLHVRTTAYRYARERGVRLGEINLIVVHPGSEVSIVFFRRGEMVAWSARHNGYLSCFGSGDLREIGRRIAAGDTEARLVLLTMCNQIAKEVGAMSAVLKGEVHAILLSGALAGEERLLTELIDRVGWIAPVVPCSGEDELEAMNSAVLRLLSGEEAEKEYS